MKLRVMFAAGACFALATITGPQAPMFIAAALIILGLS